jgi:DNA repair ATPase RecN
VKQQMETMLATASVTEEKLSAIEARRHTVDEVQTKANLISNLLDDVSVNLETLSEQKSAIDLLTEKLASIDFTMQEVQNTLQSLRTERELAERLEQSIKKLRTRTAKADIPRKAASA